jgi:L-alanine-DL-glutamate epimerase-like enolase superfamily enzyme
MRITAVEIHRLRIDARPWYFGHPIPADEAEEWEYPLLIVHTDEGLSGYSMGYGANGEGRASTVTLQDIYAPALLGTDPLWSGLTWETLRRKNRHLYAHTDASLGIVDVAIWDLRGKIAGLPLAQLLGQTRSAIPSYRTASYFLPTPEDTAAEAKHFKDAGFHGCKFNMFAGPAIDIPRLRAAREAVGDDWPLMLDASSYYSYTDALTVGRALEDLKFHWFEEPVYDRQLDVLARLTAQLRVPILTSETNSLAEKPLYLEKRAGHLLRGDVMNTAGVTGLIRAYAITAVMGYNLEMHTTSTPLLDVANLHVASSVLNCEFIETHHDMFRFGLHGSPLTPDSDGYVHTPTGPGLGVDLDWDWLDDHTIEKINVS